MKKFIIYNILLLSFLFCCNWTIQARNMSPEADLIADTKELLAIISEYDYGDSRAWLNDFQDLMRRIHNDPGIYPEVEDLMIGFLQSNASFYGKQFICTQIGIIGTKKSVPVLSKMLIDESTSEMALLALEPISDPEVDKTLRKALSKTEGKNKVGIINSLGVRKDPEAVKPLSKLVFHENNLISTSSVSALGKIATDPASQILGNSFKKAEVPLKWTIADAWLRTTNHTAVIDQSFPIYEEIYNSNPPVSIKTAALKGVLKTYSGDPSDYLLTALKDPDPVMAEAVIPLIRNLEKKYSTDVYVKELPNLETYLQMQLVLAIADRGDPSAHGLLLNLLKSDNKDLRLAGLMTFPDYAESSDIVFLARFAAENKGRERDLARKCLNTMNGENVDDAIISVVQKACPEERVELIRAMGFRNIVEGYDLLLVTATHPERKVRIESYKTLAKIGTPENLPSIVELMINAESSAERKEAEKTITSIAETIPDKSARSDYILKVLPEITDLDAQVSCINILGNLGSDNSLPVLRAYLTSEENNIQIAAIKALSAWPDSAPKEDLKGILQKTEDKKQHTLAMQGYIRLIITDSKIHEDEKAKEIDEAFSLAATADEQKIVISGLAKVNSFVALEMAVKLLDESELQSEAEAAIIDIAGAVGRQYPEDTRKILNSLLNDSQNPDFKSRIEETIKWMN